ncbi:MAG: hypothetical protein ABIC82_05230 [bacterium]
MTKYNCGEIDNCGVVSFFSNEEDGKILLLVKDKMLLLLHKMLFNYYGYRVKAIAKPEVICGYLKIYRPALVVFDMDIRKSLCKKIAAYLKKAKIPTLLIINSGDECDVCKYLEPGMCDYVDSLSDEIHLIIKKAERLMKGGGG